MRWQKLENRESPQVKISIKFHWCDTMSFSPLTTHVSSLETGPTSRELSSVGACFIKTWSFDNDDDALTRRTLIIFIFLLNYAVWGC